jgi:hypothetical protein
MARTNTLACMIVTSALVWGASSVGFSQQEEPRRSGPRDWSHNRLVASRFGPDNDRNLAKNWRTLRKHLAIESAQAERMRPRDFFELLRERLRALLAPVTTTTDDAKLDWNLRTGGFGPVVGYPAKYNFDISASHCSDVTYFTVDHAGAAATVNVIAITNPYAGCSGNAAGTTPTVKFGLRMGTGTATSAVPSLDGQTLYVFESRTIANGGVILHAINVNNIVSNVGTYNFGSTNWSNAHTLAAPTGLASSEQKFQLTYAGVFNNVSSPYLDYDTNQIFFGDSAGRIHRVTNVNSTAAAKDTTNFPVSCGTQALQSPVFVNGQVIVTSADGKLYRIDTTLPPPYACIAARQAGEGTTAGAGGGLSAPMVDVTNNKILVTTNFDFDFSLRGIGAFNLMFAAGEASTSQALLGSAAGTLAPTAPAFDDQFWSTNDGNLYAGGGMYTGTGTYLLRVPYTAGTLAATAGYATLRRTGAAAAVATSPVTEFLTASSLANPDFIYVGGSGGTYNFMNRIASGFAGSNTTPVATANFFAASGGVTSGIVIDTRTTAMTGTTATANIYFGTVGVPSTTQSQIIQLAQQF